MKQKKNQNKIEELFSSYSNEIKKLENMNSLIDAYNSNSANKDEIIHGIDKFIVNYTGNQEIIPKGKNPESKIKALKRIIGTEALDAYSHIPGMTEFSLENLPYISNFEFLGGLEKLSKEFNGEEFDNRDYHRIKKDLKDVLEGKMSDEKLGKIIKNHYQKEFQEYAKNNEEDSLKYEHFSDIIAELAVDNKTLISEGISGIVSKEEVEPYIEKNKDKIIEYSTDIVRNVKDEYGKFLNSTSKEYGNEYKGYEAIKEFSNNFSKCIEPYINQNKK